MKKINLRLVVSLILVVIVSCDEPDTVVTNIVHPDGSVTRKIVMRNTKNKFEKTDLQVPFDNTWAVTDSLEISAKGDTTWIKRAEKLFKNVEEINVTYHNDSSINGKIPRYATLNKKFRWFNTEYRFSEIVDKQILSGYPVSDFLNDEELTYFYSPDYIKFNKENGVDSIKYKMRADSIYIKTEKWAIKNIASMWIEEFSKLAGSKAGPELSKESLKSREDDIVAVIEEDKEIFDSLWTAGILLKKFIGEADVMKFKTEADSAFSVVLENFFVDFRNYSIRIVIPGKLIATNGYIDSTKNLLWPVKSDFFMTDRYEMWAKSKTTNVWAWVVSCIFLVFVVTGVIVKRKKG
jgi:hypothetical protein